MARIVDLRVLLELDDEALGDSEQRIKFTVADSVDHNSGYHVLGVSLADEDITRYFPSTIVPHGWKVEKIGAESTPEMDSVVVWDPYGTVAGKVRAPTDRTNREVFYVDVHKATRKTSSAHHAIRKIVELARLEG